MSEAIEGTATEIGTELVPHDGQPPATLFHTDDPVEVLARAGRVADALKSVIDRQGLVANIQGRDYVKVEGWSTLGSMLGVVPVVAWTRRTEDGWEARVEAKTLDGRTVGAAEAMCSKAEKTWKSRDDYALRSMAQTRATSKALRGPLGFVVTLAGYEATPAEEMPAEGFQNTASQNTASPAQLKFLRSLITQHAIGGLNAELMDRLFAGVGFQRLEGEKVNDAVKRLSRDQCSSLIEFIKDGPIRTGESDVPVDAEDFTHPPEPDDHTDGIGPA